MKSTAKLPPDLLKKEIEMQTKALRRISSWISICLVISSIGVLLIYFGLSENTTNYYFLVPGIIILILGLITSVTFGYGYRNGKRNVEKMINALENEIKKS